LRAYCLIRREPHYRRDSFEKGLKAAGYQVTDQPPQRGQAGDVLVIWNRYAHWEQMADRFEREGGTVIVAENGYIDPGRHTDRRWYALAIGGHNGQGKWPREENELGLTRWEAIAPRLGVTLAPWREHGEHVLVCPNRDFGRAGHIMPANWAQRTVDELRKYTKRPIRVRAHPGNNKPERELAEDLRGCWAMVIWYTSAGVQALLAGIPVISLAPAWICKDAALDDLAGVEDLFGPWMNMGMEATRLRAFQRLAWAQFHIDEIATGEPFLLMGNGERGTENGERRTGLPNPQSPIPNPGF
jgi:hypothetical protein